MRSEDYTWLEANVSDEAAAAFWADFWRRHGIPDDEPMSPPPTWRQPLRRLRELLAAAVRYFRRNT